VALRLKRNGVTRIRPLQGGLNVWMSREFPVEDLKAASHRDASHVNAGAFSRE